MRFKPSNIKLVNKLKVVESIFFKLGEDTKNPKITQFLEGFKDQLLKFIRETISNTIKE
jgi:hypothetical protein